MGANIPYLTDVSGRRGYLRYQFGTHFWQPFRQTDFSRGIVRDLAKTDIPANGLYDAQDYFVHREGHLIKRNGTAYAGHALGGLATSATGVMYAEFGAGAQLLGLSDIGDNGGSADGHLYVVTVGSATDKGGVATHSFHSIANPVMFFGPSIELAIWPQDEGGGAVPIIYDGSTTPVRLDHAGNGAPDGKYVAVYKGRLIVAGGSGRVNRVNFSPAPDPTTAWDTSNSWIDFDHPITGMVALQNALLVFSSGRTERLVGTTPPSSTDSGDMDRQPVGDIGCTDARSIATYQNSAIIASTRGIYMTNGVGFRSLTAGPHGNDGIETYWQKTVLAGYNASTDVIAGGVIRDFYIVSVSTNNITLMCHIPTGAWTRLNNVHANMFASAASNNDELYYADRSSPNLVKLSVIFADENDVSGTGTDADGTAVVPMFETRAFGGGLAIVAWGDAHLIHGMNDTSPASTPTLACQYLPHAYSSEGSYATSPDSPLAAEAHGSFHLIRKRFRTGADAQAMSLKVTQSNASSATVVRAIEIEGRTYPNPVEGPTS